MAAGLLVGRVALVTGGGSGIGRAVCKAMASEGARVAVADVNAAAAMETAQLLGGDHKGFDLDVSSSASVNQLVKDIHGSFGGPATVVVNSAGILRDTLLLKMNEEKFDQVLNVNLKGTYLINQATAGAMVKEKVPSGSITNISSIVGKTGNVGQTNYTAAKAGVIGLTKSVAREMARFGIRCNAVLPGFIETPMTDTVPEKVMNMMLQLIPAGRMGKPEEIADTCVFLASDKSSYITGATIEVTGGFSM